MDLITLIVVLIIVGVFLWALQTFIPMDPTIKRIIYVVVLLVVLLWVLSAFGLLNSNFRLGN